MVPFNESDDRINEFWRLNEAKAGYELALHGHDEATQESASTGHTVSPKASPRYRAGKAKNLHLMVVWFDLLLVGEESLLRCKWDGRAVVNR